MHIFAFFLALTELLTDTIQSGHAQGPIVCPTSLNLAGISSLSLRTEVDCVRQKDYGYRHQGNPLFPNNFVIHYPLLFQSVFSRFEQTPPKINTYKKQTNRKRSRTHVAPMHQRVALFMIRPATTSSGIKK